MNAEYLNDAARGEGYGLFLVSDLVQQPEPQMVSFSLKRSSDGCYLCDFGWQDSEDFLVPDSVTLRDGEKGTLALALSPAVVDQLDELEAYRLSLYNQGKPLACCVLKLSGIVYSLTLSNSAVAGAPAPHPVLPFPEPVVEIIPPLPVEPPLAFSTEAEQSPVTRSRWSRNWLLLIAFVCFLLLLGPGWYLTREKTLSEQNAVVAEEVVPEAPAVAPSPPVKPAEIPVVIPAVPPSSTPTPPAPTPSVTAPSAPTPPVTEPSAPTPPAAISSKEQVQAFMARAGTPEQALKLARSLPRTTRDEQDAVFLLMEIAAEGDLEEAMLETARFYSPASPSPSGSIVKDAEQALNWYTKAAARPETAKAASDEMGDLVRWLRAQAEAGSAEASDLLERAQ